MKFISGEKMDLVKLTRIFGIKFKNLSRRQKANLTNFGASLGEKS